MREIKFRAKTTVKDEDVAFNNVWVEGDLIFSRRKPYIHPKANAVNVKGELGKITVMHEVQAETVCQYTGLKDKNGKEIYEGDIVKHLFREDTAVIKFGKYQNVFDNQECCHCGFYVDWQTQYTKNERKDLGYWIEMLEKSNIVGNIYDNFFQN